MKKNKSLTEIEQEKSMYIICFSILAICLILLLFLQLDTSTFIFDGSITGAVVSDINLTPTIIEEKRPYIIYENISLGNITQELALNAILQAEKDMEEMQVAGFGIAWVNDTLIEAKKYFEGENYTALLGEIYKISDLEKREKAKTLVIEAQKKIGVPVDYELVLEKTKVINERKAQAYEIKDLIRAAELRIKDFAQTGLNATALFELLSNAKTEFKEERFEDSIGLLNKIEPKINEIESENTLVKTIYRVGKETTINFIKEHYIAIIITLIILIIIFLLSYNRVMVKILKRKLYDMGVEKDVLTELIKKAQSDYYSKGIIPKKTYEIKMSKYKERMQQIKEQLPVLQARLDKLSKMKRVV